MRLRANRYALLVGLLFVPCLVAAQSIVGVWKAAPTKGANPARSLTVTIYKDGRVKVVGMDRDTLTMSTDATYTYNSKQVLSMTITSLKLYGRMQTVPAKERTSSVKVAFKGPSMMIWRSMKDGKAVGPAQAFRLIGAVPSVRKKK